MLDEFEIEIFDIFIEVTMPMATPIILLLLNLEPAIDRNLW